MHTGTRGELEAHWPAFAPLALGQLERRDSNHELEAASPRPPFSSCGARAGWQYYSMRMSRTRRATERAGYGCKLSIENDAPPKKALSKLSKLAWIAGSDQLEELSKHRRAHACHRIISRYCIEAVRAVCLVCASNDVGVSLWAFRCRLVQKGV